jgi:hypothetical protein
MATHRARAPGMAVSAVVVFVMDGFRGTALLVAYRIASVAVLQ